MSFTSWTFFALLAVTLPLHWLLPWQRGRLALLLAASLVFYSWRHWPSLLLLLATIGLNHAAAQWQARVRARGASARARGRILALVIALDLLPLLWFKYASFFLGSVAAGLGALAGLLGALGVSVPAPPPQPLPLGISFFTFQVIAYQVDVFRGTVAAEPSLLRFAVFKSFFAQLIAGPIVRAAELLPQLRERRRFDARAFHQGLFLLCAGLALKLGVADVLRQFADEAFGGPGAASYGRLSTTAAWTGLLAYAAQLYADFWGYSTLAVGLGLLFGIELPINFRTPYLAGSLQDFWRRWHVTLSIWFRDYVYFPLGGNRAGGAARTRNLLVTMGLAGLWHGAGWSFVAWGLLHGAWLAAERALAGRVRLPRALATPLVFLGVCLLWVPFRAPGAHAALAYAARLLLPPYSASTVPPVLWGWLLGFALLHAPLSRLIEERGFPALTLAKQTTLAAALLLFALAMAGAQVDFVYFNF